MHVSYCARATTDAYVSYYAISISSNTCYVAACARQHRAQAYDTGSILYGQAQNHWPPRRAHRSRVAVPSRPALAGRDQISTALRGDSGRGDTVGSCSAASTVSAVVFVFVPVLVPVPAVLVPGSLLVSGSSIDMMTDSDSDIESGIESPVYVSTAYDAATTIGRHVRGRLWRKWFDDTVDTVAVRLVHDVLHGVLRDCWPWWSEQERLSHL